jgi:hypothetical protein
VRTQKVDGLFYIMYEKLTTRRRIGDDRLRVFVSTSTAAPPRSWSANQPIRTLIVTYFHRNTTPLHSMCKNNKVVHVITRATASNELHTLTRPRKLSAPADNKQTTDKNGRYKQLRHGADVRQRRTAVGAVGAAGANRRDDVVIFLVIRQQQQHQWHFTIRARRKVQQLRQELAPARHDHAVPLRRARASSLPQSASRARREPAPFHALRQVRVRV